MFAMVPLAESPAPPTSAPPPLQEGTRLLWSALREGATEEDGERLKAYLSSQCASTALVRRAEELQGGRTTLAVFWDKASAAAIARDVASREEQVLVSARERSQKEMMAAAGMLKATDAIAAEYKASVNTRSVFLNSTSAEGGLVATTMQLKSGEGDSSPFILQTFRPAAVAVQPFLTLMEAAGTIGEYRQLSQHFEEGVKFLTANGSERSLCQCFGVLELCRHFLVHAFAQGSAADAIQACRTLGESGVVKETLDGAAASCVAQLQHDVEEMKRLRQQTDQLSAHVDIIICLLRDYFVFFNITMGVCEGLSGQFQKLAWSLLPDGGAIYGTTRFPHAQPFILHTSVDGSAQTKTGRNAIHGGTENNPVAFSSPERFSSEKTMPTATRGCIPVVSHALTKVFAPAHSASAFLILSALGSLPLSKALDVAVTVSELHSLYQDCPVLLKLVRSMWRGRLGDVWVAAQEAAGTLLNRQEPLVTPTVLAALMDSVRQAVCYQYAVTRCVVDLRAGARQLNLVGGPSALLSELEPLVRSGRLPMRINTVDQTMTLAVPPHVSDAVTVTEQAVLNSGICIAEAEMALRAMAVRRQLTHPTVESFALPVVEGGGTQSRYHDRMHDVRRR